MKLRRAAALALVGWYLMTPPVVHVNGKLVALTKAPFWQWETETFDDVASCEAAPAAPSPEIIGFLGNPPPQIGVKAINEPRLNPPKRFVSRRTIHAARRTENGPIGKPAT